MMTTTDENGPENGENGNKKPSRPQLFGNLTLDHVQRAPQVLADTSTSALISLTQREGSLHVIKSLARELAERDLECTRLRKQLELSTAALRQHLREAHNLTHREADEMALDITPVWDDAQAPHEMTKDTRSILAEDALSAELSEAASGTFSRASHYGSRDELITDRSQIDSSRSHNTGQRSASNASWAGWFAGTGTTTKKRSKTTTDRSVAGVLSATQSSHASPPEPSNMQVFNSPPSNSSVMPQVMSVELDPVTDLDELPPPLLPLQSIKVQYPQHIADNYGFIIDKARVLAYVLGSNTSRESIRTTPSSPNDDVEPLISRPRSQSESVSRPGTSGSASNSLKKTSTNENKKPTWTELLKAHANSALDRMSNLPVVSYVSRTNASSDELSTDVPSDSDSDAGLSDEGLNIDYEDEAMQLRVQIDQQYTAQETARREEAVAYLNKWGQTPTTSTIWGKMTLKKRPPQLSAPSPPEEERQFGVANLAQCSSAKRIALTQLVLHGISMSMRRKLWTEKARAHLTLSPSQFHLLIHTHSAEAHHWMASIDADVPRTLTSNVFFRSASAGTLGARRVSDILKAFANHRPRTGYCQGMNIIAGLLVLALPSADDAFLVFTHLILHVLPSRYFDDGQSVGAHVDAVVLRRYMRRLLPRLATHFDTLDIPDAQTVPIAWFITAFAATLSVEAVFRVWDVVLSIPKQDAFLLRVAIALLKVHEGRLLGIGSASELYSYLDRRMGGTEASIDGLIQASWALRPVVKEEEVARVRGEVQLTLGF